MIHFQKHNEGHYDMSIGRIWFNTHNDNGKRKFLFGIVEWFACEFSVLFSDKKVIAKDY